MPNQTIKTAHKLRSSIPRCLTLKEMILSR